MTELDPEASKSSRWRRWWRGLFSLQEYHYPGFLPSRPNFLLRHTLDRLFARVTLPTRNLERLRQLGRQGAVVYALKYRSNLDFLFFNRRYREVEAPCPEFAFELNLWFWQPLSHLIQILSTAVNYICRRKSWPNPYRDGHFQRLLAQGQNGLLFLVDEAGFRQRFFLSSGRPHPPPPGVAAASALPHFSRAAHGHGKGSVQGRERVAAILFR